MNNDILRAVTLIRSSPHLEDDELYQTLVASGMDRRRSARLIEFLPTAYTRLILRNSGVRVSDKFQRRLPNREISFVRAL